MWLPIVLHSLGLPVLEEMQGSVPSDLYQADAMRAHPVTVAKAVSSNGAKPADNTVPATMSQPVAMSQEDEQVVMERLRELGYIE